MAAKKSVYVEVSTSKYDVDAVMKAAVKDYDFEREKNKDYSLMSEDKQVSSIADFTSRIWQVHPFREGNTRTTAVFMIKYLSSKGFDINNDLFKEYSKYFRNALVLSNFDDMKAKISSNFQYLNNFYKKLLIDNSIKLEEIINPYEKEQKITKNNIRKNR